jgi:putative ABC transport system permease protein
MKLRDGVRIAGRSLAGHRLRSALTTVGIVIGIATVIIFASFGTSVQTDIVGEFEETAASEIIIVTGDVGFDPSEGGGGGPPPSPDELGNVALPGVTTHDLKQISEIEGVQSVIPRGTIDASSVSYRNQTEPQSVIATTPAALPEENFVSGGAFEQGESGSIVLTESAANAFDSEVGVNDTIRVDYGNERENFSVAGIITQARGGLNVFGGFGSEVYVPTDPYYRDRGDTVESPSQGVRQAAYRQVTVVANPSEVSETRERIEAYFAEESDAGQIVEDGVTVQSTAQIVDGIESVLGDVIQLVSGIGVLALLVGAFGIANIMLVSVTERTKEIGIMKANGAHNREIMGLFLAEAVLLGLAGAVVGIPVGLLVGFGAASYAEVGFTIPYGWVLIGTAMGIVTGIVAGLYPAWRAARVDPIDALRYE